MEQELQIPNARDKFEFQRVHRLGKPKANESRPIIARFLRYQDREVLNQARKTLRDKDYSVFEDTLLFSVFTSMLINFELFFLFFFFAV